MGRDEEVRQIAYKLWEDEGRPLGRDLEYWLQAEAVWQRQQGQKPPQDQPQSPAQPTRGKKKRVGAGPRGRRTRQNKAPHKEV